MLATIGQVLVIQKTIEKEVEFSNVESPSGDLLLEQASKWCFLVLSHRTAQGGKEDSIGQVRISLFTNLLLLDSCYSKDLDGIK